jgi:NAD(P)-dependent dehydrogenase (short-subunit alcohol dehydrogenase family)
MSSSARLQDKVAIVTGASSGLGRAIAIRYSQEGAKVVCADLTPTARSQDESEITTHDLIVKKGGKATFVQTDVGEAAQMENLVQVAVREYGRLDMYVCYSHQMLSISSNDRQQSGQQRRHQYRGTQTSCLASHR